MDAIGFSTGAVAGSHLQGALALLAASGTDAVELSALRAHELGPLLRAIPHLELHPYRHVSVHAPSAFAASEEREIARALQGVAERGWPVVLHPDAIRDFGAWEALGGRLCIENMDGRKPGRTVEELAPVFRRLPRASFCFDVAHARQVDPSMAQAARLLQAFGERLAEVHVSELGPRARHLRLTAGGIADCQRVAGLIPPDVPAIIEAPVLPHELEDELRASLEALERVPACAWTPSPAFLP